jgi:hypothetical protein
MNTQEFREFQEMSKNIASLVKSIDKSRTSTEKLASNTDKKTVERQKIDAMTELSKTIREATTKITSSIDALTREIKKKD